MQNEEQVELQWPLSILVSYAPRRLTLLLYHISLAAPISPARLPPLCVASRPTCVPLRQSCVRVRRAGVSVIPPPTPNHPPSSPISLPSLQVKGFLSLPSDLQGGRGWDSRSLLLFHLMQ